jgi:hypothetical protein
VNQYLVISDGGDGDISYSIYDTPEEAEAEFNQEAEWDAGAYGIFKVDFNNNTITRTHYSQ